MKFYEKNSEITPVCWDWDEHLDIPKFLKEKAQEIKKSKLSGEVILMADSMGGNLAWTLINHFPDLQYVLVNPAFCAEQILDQNQILPEMREKIFTATAENIKNRNGRLVISLFDKTLDSTYYQQIFGEDLPVLKVPEEHNIPNFFDYMPEIHKLILNAFECAKNKKL